MYKLLVIAHREYAAMVATKAFLFTLVMMPILMFGGLVLMPQLSKIGGGKTKKIIVADGTGKLFDSLKSAVEARNAQLRKGADASSDKDSSEEGKRDFGRKDSIGDTSDFWELEQAAQLQFDDAQKIAWSNQIREGKLYAFVEIPADTITGFEKGQAIQVTFVSQDALLSSARQWMNGVVQETVRSMRLNQLGVDTRLVAQANLPIQFVPTLPYKEADGGKATSSESGNVLVTLLLPFGIMMLMFMVIFLAAQPMLESGMEEKTQRIAEVLLGSVSPTQLMAGKLLGNVAGSLMIFLIYGLGGWLVADTNEWTKELPWSLVPWFIVFQLLGVLFFSSIFLTVGASISELKEAQSLLMPVWLVMVAPMMIWLVALRDPNGPVAVTMSFFPPTAPLMMILRLSSGQTIPAWQPPVAALVLVLTTALVVYFAGRIYRASLLRTDSARTLRQIFGRLGHR